jgi:hypothetical protein
MADVTPSPSHPNTGMAPEETDGIEILERAPTAGPRSDSPSASTTSSKLITKLIKSSNNVTERLVLQAYARGQLCGTHDTISALTDCVNTHAKDFSPRARDLLLDCRQHALEYIACNEVLDAKLAAEVETAVTQKIRAKTAIDDGGFVRKRKKHREKEQMEKLVRSLEERWEERKKEVSQPSPLSSRSSSPAWSEPSLPGDFSWEED